MRKFSHNKRRALSGAFNVALFVLLMATFAVLLWLLPHGVSSAVQTQTRGQAAQAPTVLETPTVYLGDGTPASPGVLVTVVFSMPVPSRLGVVIDEKRAVILIEPGSPAQKAGVQLGDILERMEDTSLLLPEDRMQARFLMNDIYKEKGYSLRLTVIRDGVTVEVPFVPEPPINPGILPDPPPPTITPVWPPYDFL